MIACLMRSAKIREIRLRQRLRRTGLLETSSKFKTIEFFFAGSISMLSLCMLRSSFSPDLVEAGCDEVGRGCLAGPVVAAAVILPKNYQHELLNDSKQLTKEERIHLQ